MFLPSLPGGECASQRSCWGRGLAEERVWEHAAICQKNTQKVRFNSLITDDRIDKQQIFGCALRKHL